MRPGDETDIDYLELILELVAHIERRLDGTTREKFEDDKDEIDLTAFRLQVIGETTNKLTKELKDRHPEIDWASIYGMRNIVAHHYQSLLAERIWNAAVNSLVALAAVCRSELKRLRK